MPTPTIIFTNIFLGNSQGHDRFSTLFFESLSTPASSQSTYSSSINSPTTTTIPQPCSRAAARTTKHTNVPLPSIHPMLSRSKAKQLQFTSPHALTSSLVLSSVHKAFLDSRWVKAMEEEFITLRHNHTWDLVPFSEDMNLIGCSWVYRIKYNPDGTML